MAFDFTFLTGHQRRILHSYNVCQLYPVAHAGYMDEPLIEKNLMSNVFNIENESFMQEIPLLVILENYKCIKAKAKQIVADELEHIRNNENLCHLLSKQNDYKPYKALHASSYS